MSSLSDDPNVPTHLTGEANIENAFDARVWERDSLGWLCKVCRCNVHTRFCALKLAKYDRDINYLVAMYQYKDPK